LLGFDIFDPSSKHFTVPIRTGLKLINNRKTANTGQNETVMSATLQRPDWWYVQ